MLKKLQNWIRLYLVSGIMLLAVAVVVAVAEQAPGQTAKAEQPDLLNDFLSGPMADVDEIVFAVRQLGPDGHWYANFGYFTEGKSRKAYRAMGRLCRLNLRTSELAVLLDDPEGSVRDPQVHYDGRKILFSYRRGGTESFFLYEINTDGTGLRQLTSGPDGRYDDIEPTYLPDGGIMFVSSRCDRWVNCWLTQVATLYRCDGDGRNIRPISANLQHDNTPWPLPDGRILYQRWEYVDRSQVHYHHLWTANPDGTGQTVYYGNMHPGIVMIDAKPIPGTDNKIVAVFSPSHGRREHNGRITIVSPKSGPDEKSSARQINPSKHFRDPYPLSDDCFLVVNGPAIFVMNGRGQTQEIYHLAKDLEEAGARCHEVRPLRKRPRERVIAPIADMSETTGRVVLTDVYRGRNMAGVRRGEIKELLIIESLPKPINYTGGMEPLSYGGTFTLERILGTVPVEPDGSAYMEIPAMRSLFFVALDENRRSVKRMQSFMTVAPGETLGCVGCHEQRTHTPVNPGRGSILALKRSPSRIAPIAGVPDVLDFPRDIQPILDKHCVSCHGTESGEKGGPREGGILLTGDRGPMFSHSYFTLSAKQQIADGRNRPKSNYPPRALGSSGSKLMEKLEPRHHDVRLSRQERDTIKFWVETGAPYPGTYAALGCGMIGGYAQNKIDQSDRDWPSMKAKMKLMEKRCGQCHTGPMQLPVSPSDNMGMPPWKINYESPKLRFSRHILYNLTRPQKSLLLLAPLSKEGGGYGLCKETDEDGKPTDKPAVVFNGTSDADYRTMLAAIVDTAERLEQIKRFDMPGFCPPAPYVREMKRYGILAADVAADSPMDVYATDRAYCS